jgi:hypothetical protein
MDFDPWEEAARLAALPTPVAETILVSTLNLLPGHPDKSPETEILASRLVALLPKAVEAKAAKAASVAEGRPRQVNYWLVWLCIAAAMALLSPHRHTTTASEGNSAPTSKAAPPAQSKGAEPAPPDASRRADAVPAAASRD